MKISLIAAMAKDRVIGKDNQMPWHLPADLKHFKQITLGKPVVMGRKTFESIGKPLPGRRNIVISRHPPAATIAGVEWAGSLQQAFELVQDVEEAMVIGGAEIYRQCLADASRLYLTLIELETTGDTFFPDYQQSNNWRVIQQESHQPDDKNPCAYTFVTLERC